MNRNRLFWILPVFAVALLLMLPRPRLLAEFLPAPEPSPPTAFTYQGTLTDDGKTANGDYELYFLLFDAERDGNQIGNTVKLPKVSVADGIFTAQLDFGTDAWNGQSRWLETKVNGVTLTPRQPIGTVPYATYAHMVPWSGLQNRPPGLDDGDDDTTYRAGKGLTLTGTEFQAAGAPYANVVVVAKHGGDFATISAALNSIADADENNPYLVWVAPGIYTETVTMKPHIEIVGAGADITVLTWHISGGDEDDVVVVGSDAAALRNLTIKLTVDGNGTATAISNNAVASVLDNVTIRVDAEGANNVRGITQIRGNGQFRNVRIYLTCLANTSTCTGINHSASTISLENLTVIVTGANQRSTGIYTWGEDAPTAVEITQSTIQVTAHAEGGGNASHYAIQTGNGAAVTIRDSQITASGSAATNHAIAVGDSDGPGTKMIVVNHSEIVAADGSSVRAIRNSHIVQHRVRIGASLLEGNVHRGIADLRCVGAYNGSYSELNSVCQ